MGTTTFTRRRTQGGNAMIEFALVVSVFLWMFFGIIDGGKFVALASYQVASTSEMAISQ